MRVDVYPTKGGVPVQDLTVEDFEVLENGARQQVQAFEHVVVTPAGPEALRTEPNSVRAGEQAAANPRARVFVVFIDRAHVGFEGAAAIREPLIRMIDRILGPEDVVAVMTSDMSAADITFARKTQAIAEMLRTDWSYGRRVALVGENDAERRYETCFPNFSQQELVRQLIRRRRERASLDALYDLVRYLGSVREERKAIIAVSDGWPLYRPDDSMLKLREGEGIPGTPPVGVDEFGKLRVNPPRRDGNMADTDMTVCERERMYLANIDDEEYFRRLIDDANRNNASFYPVDTRGLSVFETDIGPQQPPSLTVDREMLRRRLDGLRTLADGTDGLALVDTNDFEKGLKRMADDLTSYYLLGYYSTNSKLDGQFRKISVKVKRPGVDVRARRGYRAATADEVNAGRPAAAAPVSEATKTAAAALSRLGRASAGQGLAITVTPLLDASGSRITALWIAGEVLGPREEFARGGSLNIVRKGGSTEGGVVASLRPSERTFLTKLPIDGGAATAIDLDVRVTPADQATPLTQVVKVAADAPQPMPYKRGLSTGNRIVPAASFEFSRTDRMQLQLPLSGDAKPGAGRFLDRNAQPLQIPLTVGEKVDEDGQRWLTADAVLSALAAGEYIVELSFASGGGERKVLTAIRVTR